MAPVTGTLQSGTYVITNVSSGNYATLTDANKGSELKASRDGQSDDVKWNIAKLSNNKYTIMAYVHATYAKVGANPSDGDPVVGRADEYQWDVKETGKKGEYTITPHSDDMLYWGLVNSNPGTSVKLSGNANAKSNWQFTRVQA